MRKIAPQDYHFRKPEHWKQTRLQPHGTAVKLLAIMLEVTALSQQNSSYGNHFKIAFVTNGRFGWWHFACKLLTQSK